MKIPKPKTYNVTPGTEGGRKVNGADFPGPVISNS